MSGRRTLTRVVRQPGGLIGAIMLVIVLGIAFLGPLLAWYTPQRIVGTTAQPPSSDFLLGTDFLGRDVYSRLVSGGRTVVLIAFTATAASFLIGAFLGIYAALRGGARDFVSMRLVDLLLTVPGILYLLLLASGFGRSVWVLLVGVIVVLFPPISRVVRTAALSVSKTGYVEAAYTRGDGLLTITFRDVLPNILPNILADFGIRFSASILLVAAMNFLGLGLAPPVADWGLMTSENQSIISLNVMAVVAPAAMLAFLTVAINLVADAYLRTVGRSSMPGSPTRRRFRRSTAPTAEVAGPVQAAGRPVGPTHATEVGPV